MFLFTRILREYDPIFDLRIFFEVDGSTTKRMKHMFYIKNLAQNTSPSTKVSPPPRHRPVAPRVWHVFVAQGNGEVAGTIGLILLVFLRLMQGICTGGKKNPEYFLFLAKNV